MIVKPLIELSEKDLISIPVWKYWTEEGVEFASSTNDKSVSEESPDGHIVLTEFVLNNGSKFTGFCSPQDPSGLDYIQPVLFTHNGQVNLYADKGWDKKDIQSALKKIGLTKENIFPIGFETKIKCDDKFYRGTIIDFNKNE